MLHVQQLWRDVHLLLFINAAWCMTWTQILFARGKNTTLIVYHEPRETKIVNWVSLAAECFYSFCNISSVILLWYYHNKTIILYIHTILLLYKLKLYADSICLVFLSHQVEASARTPSAHHCRFWPPKALREGESLVALAANVQVSNQKSCKCCESVKQRQGEDLVLMMLTLVSFFMQSWFSSHSISTTTTTSDCSCRLHLPAAVVAAIRTPPPITHAARPRARGSCYQSTPLSSLSTHSAAFYLVWIRD